MSDNQKYYYLKLKDNFFDSDELIWLESIQDGYLYSNILLKLYLRSLKDQGRLVLNGTMPYSSQMLATITRHQIGTIEKALEVFVHLGLVEILRNGTIYMSDIQDYIGKSSTEADRKRKYRLRIEKEKGQLESKQGLLSGQMSGQTSTRDRERDRYIEKDKCPTNVLNSEVCGMPDYLREKLEAMKYD